VLRVRQSKKPDATLHTNPVSFSFLFNINNEDLTSMKVNHILTVFLSSKVGTLPPCWDLKLGTPCERGPNLALRPTHLVANDRGEPTVSYK
jgi:hypothetical protein